MRNEDVNRIVELPFDEFTQQVKPLNSDNHKKILTKLASLKKYYEKNLTIFPQFNKKGEISHIYKDSEEKLSLIKKKGQYVASLL